MVSFTLSVNNIVFGFTFVYASKCHIRRRLLWTKLQHIQNQDNPLGFMGDFNCILEADKYRGNFTRSPMEDFQQLTNESDLVHLPTRGLHLHGTMVGVVICTLRKDWIGAFSR